MTRLVQHLPMARNILKHGHSTQKLAAVIAQGRGGHLNRHLGSVFGCEQNVIAQPSRLVLSNRLHHQVFDALVSLLVQETKDLACWFAAGAGPAPTGEFFGGGVEVANSASAVCRNDALSDAGHDGGHEAETRAKSINGVDDAKR